MKVNIKFTEGFWTCMDSYIESFYTVEILDGTVVVARYHASGKKPKSRVNEEAKLVMSALRSAVDARK